MNANTHSHAQAKTSQDSLKSVCAETNTILLHQTAQSIVNAKEARKFRVHQFTFFDALKNEDIKRKCTFDRNVIVSYCYCRCHHMHVNFVCAMIVQRAHQTYR